MTNAFLGTALWGSLFCDTAIGDEFSAARFCARMVAFESAWTDALLATGVVASGAAARTRLDDFVPDLTALGAGTDVDGLPVPELVRQLREPLTAQDRRAIHTGSTSQDVIDTAMVMTLLRCLDTLETRMTAVCSQLAALDRAFGDRPLMGRTRMQAALPVTCGDRIALWRRPLAELLDALPALRSRVAVVQIGGPVGLRDMPLGQQIAEQVAKTLDLGLASAWHTDRGRMADLGHWVTKTATALGKIGQDITLMAQQGIADLTLDGGGRSSAMPHKQNPVRGEILVAQARWMAAQQGLLMQSALHEQERSGTSWALEWMTLPGMMETTGAAVCNAQSLLDQITDMGSTR